MSLSLWANVLSSWKLIIHTLYYKYILVIDNTYAIL
jgi:hypothetical protein